MKTAEQFRKSLGGADENFVMGIRQTLMELEGKEEKPVKKKISMGLVLAMAIMLLAVTAMAAGPWGILDFMEGQGKEAPAYKLMVEVPQEQEFSRMIDMTIDEALVDGGKVYLAMTVLPKTENTIVVPRVMDISAAGGMAVMNNPAYDADLSVRAFAENKGYEKIVGFRPPMGIALKELSSAMYESMENGGLRCILEYTYEPEENDFPERSESCIWEVVAVDYREDNISTDHMRVSKSEVIQLLAEIQVNISDQTRKSQEADAHEIAGYDITIEYVTMTPMEDGSVQFTMTVDADNMKGEKFHFFHAALLDAEGQQLCRMDLGMHATIINNKEFWYGVIPAEYAQTALADQVTIQLQKRVGLEWQETDTHTYTME